MSEKSLSPIDLSDFRYGLPAEKIAKFPLKERSESKLLKYEKGKITHHIFNEIAGSLNKGTLLVFNDTKVIPARIHFKKDTGALIEVFLLEPALPTNNVAEAMTVTTTCVWKCMIGNLKRWKDGQVLAINLNGKLVLRAYIADRQNQWVKFEWNDSSTFANIVEEAGKIPLPPYIDREVVIDDSTRYQTIYSHSKGAVAAPTAGLHFDDKVMLELDKKGVDKDYLTLHVSAGTFQPVKEENALDHPMHSEQIIITRENINHLLGHESIVAVGTTSMRTLESLYWYGVKLLTSDDRTFHIEKLFPYGFSDDELPERNAAINAVLAHMQSTNMARLEGKTEIFIIPGYTFKMCNGLVTNFHLPGSTLILLVAAFVGNDWHKLYEEALTNDYRFLSYGDSSLLLP